MATNINADNGVVSGSAGLKTTADSSGVLALQSNGTTALTINTSQALGVGSTPSFGTSGQVLSSAGSSAAPTWVTPPSTSPAGSTGQVQYNNAGAFGAVSSGTSGQVLTSAGAGVVPTWATPAGGGSMILLGFTNATNVTSVIMNLDSTQYDNYIFDFYEMTAPAATGVVIFQMKAANGTFYSTYFLKLLTSNSYGPQKASGDSLTFSTINPTSYGETTKLPAGQLVILGASQASNEALILGSSVEKLGGENAINTMVGWHSNSGPYSQIKVFNNNGNISGKFALYGIKKS